MLVFCVFIVYSILQTFDLVLLTSISNECYNCVTEKLQYTADQANAPVMCMQLVARKQRRQNVDASKGPNREVTIPNQTSNQLLPQHTFY